MSNIDVLGRDICFFGKRNYFDSNKNFSETDIIKMST
jgi:hypothetical protein